MPVLRVAALHEFIQVFALQGVGLVREVHVGAQVSTATQI
jgi:hypothetical protein